MQSFEQFNKHGQAAENIKRYVKRVFVTADFTDRMPSYHSFVKGVVNSDDPPLNVSRFKRERGRQLKAITEEEDSGDRPDDGVRDDQHQKFNLPINETTNPVNSACPCQWNEEDTACRSIDVWEQNNGFTACLIQKAVEEHSLLEAHAVRQGLQGERGQHERHRHGCPDVLHSHT
jgi:hypothetical protein